MRRTPVPQSTRQALLQILEMLPAGEGSQSTTLVARGSVARAPHSAPPRTGPRRGLDRSAAPY